jgi:hypothetical protein
MAEAHGWPGWGTTYPLLLMTPSVRAFGGTLYICVFRLRGLQCILMKCPEVVFENGVKTAENVKLSYRLGGHHQDASRRHLTTPADTQHNRL